MENLHELRTRTDMRTNTKYGIKTEISYFCFASSKALRFPLVSHSLFLDLPQSRFLSSRDSEEIKAVIKAKCGFLKSRNILISTCFT